MSYIDEGIDGRKEVLAGATDSIVFFPKVNGKNVTPSSATVKVLSQAGAVLVAEQATVPGANGRLTFSQPWPEATYPLGEDYVVVWGYTVSGVAYSERMFFDVVRSKLQCQISHTDLLDTYPDLEDSYSGIATALADGDAETTSARFIRKAWADILGRIRAGGNRPSLLLDVRRLTNAAIELALHYAAQALEKEPGDLWNGRKVDHRANYEREWSQLGQFKYDFNEDGLADNEEETRVNRIRFHV